MSYGVERVEVEASRIVAVRRSTTFGPELGGVIGEAYEELYDALPDDAGARPGHNVIAYVPTGESTADLYVGRHWEDAIPGGLEVFDLPAGTVARTRHVGPYEDLPRAHRAIHGWMNGQGLTEVGLNWEVYGDWSDDPSQLVTEVHYVLPDPA